MSATNFCQSCGMPLEGNPELLGTNADGSKNNDFCSYCFTQGHFTSDMTMDEMIELCIPHLIQHHKGMTEEEGRKMMKAFFPKLKRWAR